MPVRVVDGVRVRARVRPARAAAALTLCVLAAVIGLAAASTLEAATALPEVPVTAVDLFADADRANNSPMLAQAPDQPLVALANRIDAPKFGCALHLSRDRGRGWVPAQPLENLPAGVEKCYAPEVAFDRAGTLYFLFVGLHGPGNVPVGVYLTRSTDGGRSFSEADQILGPNTFQVHLLIDPEMGRRGRIHVTWLQASGVPPIGGFPDPPNPVMAFYSDDGGKRFSTPVRVSDGHRERVVGTAIALGKDHAVHVLYYDLQDDAVDYQGLEGPAWGGQWSVVLATSPDAGGHFGPGVVVDDAIVPPERVMLILTMPGPAVAADGRGRVFAAWSDGRHGDADILVRRSLDAGRSWGPTVRLNDDDIGNGRSQRLPRLSIAPGGRVDAVFYDRRDDPANLADDVWFTSSAPDGDLWSANIRVTSASSSSLVGPTYPIRSAKGLIEFGSRIALLSSDATALAAWTDTRNAPHDGRGQDIFSTTVDLHTAVAPPDASDAGRAPMLPVAGVLVVLAAGGASYLLRRRR